MISISSKENKLFEAMNIIYENMVNDADSSTYGRILSRTSNEYSVDVEGVTYKIKSQFDFTINERVLVLSPSGGTEKYLYPNKMGTSGEVVDAYTKAETDILLTGKVDAITGKGLSTNDYTTVEKNKLSGIANNANNYTHPSTHPASIITETTSKRFVSDSQITAWNTVSNKVDVVDGKGLSTNDYTTAEKNKLSGIANNATANDTDTNLKNRANHTGTQSADTITDGTTNKVLSATMKTHYDEAYTNNHTHSNKGSLDLVSGTNTGDETVVSIGGLINSATTKMTPVDADMVGLMDSGASNVLKKLSWSNIKATLKTYFDTLYNNYVHPATHDASIITQDINNRFVTDAEKATWNGKSNLTLGETILTAYRGDRGKIAYDHSQVVHAPSNAQKNSDITKAEIETKLTGTVNSHTHNYLPLEGGTVTGTLVLNSTNPEIQFNGTSDTGVDMAIKATPEGLDFYEPEDSDLIQFQILDDVGVNSPNGYKVGGTTVIDNSGRVLKSPTITLSGDATGSATLTNLGNATLSVVVIDDSHNHVISNVDGLQAALDGKSSTTHTHNELHTHSNKSLLDGITSTLINNWNSAFSHITDVIKHITSAERTLWNTVSNKVDKITGKQLSTEDYTTTEKTKLSGVEYGANKYIHPTQTAITSDNSNGVVIQDISVNNLGHTTSVGTVDLDNRYYTESEIDNKFASLPTDSKISKTFTIPATTGWYRIAQSPIDTKQASGLVEINWNSVNGHEGHEIASVSSWGNYTATLTQLLCSSSYGTPYIYQMRVVRPSTTSGNRAYLEIYLQYAHQTEVKVSIENNVGWEFLDLETGLIPSGWTTHTLVFYRSIPFSTSNTSACVGLNAAYLQGLTSSSFQRQKKTTSALPTPSSSYRNFLYWLNQSGHNDKPYIGIRNADGKTYAFKELATTEYVDNAASSGGSGDNYDTATTWNAEETVFTTTWTDGTKNYSSVVTELSDTQYRKQMYVDGVLTEQWDMTETASSITTDYTKF